MAKIISFTFFWNSGMANIWSCDVLPKISFLFPRMLFWGFIFQMKHTLLITTWDTAIQEGVAFFPNLSSVQLLSCVRVFVTPWSTACQASLSFTNSQSLLKYMPIKSVMPSNQLILCHPLHLPSIFPRIRVFSRKSVLHIRWPKYWGFSFSICPYNEYSGLISFRIDWLDLLADQDTLKSLLQQHSSKASIFGAQLSLWSNSHIHTWPLEKP